MKTTSEPLVSVVTPVYNTEKYLAECIESVLAQTYPTWEYIIVNNCSTDRSRAIAQQYAAQDQRIRLVNNAQLLKQMPNWNHAMRQISPESRYCKVVHADDWLFPDCLTQMVALAEAHPSVGLVGAYRLDEDQVNLDGLPYPSTVTSGQVICRQALLGGPYVFGSPTSLLIRADLVREREEFYNESNIHADKEVCFEILNQHDFGFVHQVLTFTRRHNEATTSHLKRFKTTRTGNLYALLKYGPVYLTPAEYRQRLAHALDRYYTFLGQCVFELREKEFWKYQQSELAKLGLALSWWRVGRAAFWHLLNVRNTLVLFKHNLRRGSQAQPPVLRHSSDVIGD
jgi:glycosyltransferase involved in cell wall biosynthesis